MYNKLLKSASESDILIYLASILVEDKMLIARLFIRVHLLNVKLFSLMLELALIWTNALLRLDEAKITIMTVKNIIYYQYPYLTQIFGSKIYKRQ